jgi:hypothetical protein
MSALARVVQNQERVAIHPTHKQIPVTSLTWQQESGGPEKRQPLEARATRTPGWLLSFFPPCSAGCSRRNSRRLQRRLRRTAISSGNASVSAGITTENASMKAGRQVNSWDSLGHGFCLPARSRLWDWSYRLSLPAPSAHPGALLPRTKAAAWLPHSTACKPSRPLAEPARMPSYTSTAGSSARDSACDNGQA